MEDILESIGDAIHEFFVDVCGGMFLGIFDDANAATGDIARQVGLGLPEGNAKIIEDVSADVVDRQFIAIQSKNGNTFYIVIDKDSKGKENVYFMNLVDEYQVKACDAVANALKFNNAS